MTEDEMVGWHHLFSGHELGQTPGDNEGQRGLVCCNPWGCKESHTAGQEHGWVSSVAEVARYRRVNMEWFHVDEAQQ